MAVLPPSSAENLLPSALSKLVSSSSDSSVISDMYPSTWETDLNGHMQKWKAVVKLPFVDMGRLVSSATSALQDLSVQEKKSTHLKRNLRL